MLQRLAFGLLVIVLCGCSGRHQAPPTVVISVSGANYIVDHRRCTLDELTQYLTELAEHSRLESTGSSRWRIHIVGSSANLRAKAAGDAAMLAGFPNIYYHEPR